MKVYHKCVCQQWSEGCESESCMSAVGGGGEGVS